MSFLHIAGYKFFPLLNLPQLQLSLEKKCEELRLKGTILLSSEGINLMLAGNKQNIFYFKDFMQNDLNFETYCEEKKNSLNLQFNESPTDTVPYKRLKIKLKKEIITIRQPQINPAKNIISRIQPTVLKKWLDEKRSLTLFDVRNSYEIKIGSFCNSVELGINHFSEFPNALKKISFTNPIVTFCTGGIRCEKAVLLMQEYFEKNIPSYDLQSPPEIYQLNGGILNYFAQVGSAHYAGHCFVFDDRGFVSAENLSQIENK